MRLQEDTTDDKDDTDFHPTSIPDEDDREEKEEEEEEKPDTDYHGEENPHAIRDDDVEDIKHPGYTEY